MHLTATICNLHSRPQHSICYIKLSRGRFALGFLSHRLSRQTQSHSIIHSFLSSACGHVVVTTRWACPSSTLECVGLDCDVSYWFVKRRKRVQDAKKKKGIEKITTNVVIHHFSSFFFLFAFLFQKEIP